MNKRMILYIQGAILLIEAAIMVLPIAAALITWKKSFLHLQRH